MPVSLIVISVFLALQTTQASIEGTVVNSVTNKPIAGAQVLVVSSGVKSLPHKRPTEVLLNYRTLIL